MCRSITFWNFLLDLSAYIFRILNVSYTHSIKSKASGHLILLEQGDIDKCNMRQFFVTKIFSQTQKNKRLDVIY